VKGKLVITSMKAFRACMKVLSKHAARNTEENTVCSQNNKNGERTLTM